MIKNEKEKEVESEGGAVYEIGYLLMPTLSVEQAPTEANKIHDLIKKEGGSIISEEEPKLRDLAYTVERTFANKKDKFDSAYFGWVKFEIDQAIISDIDKKLKQEEAVVRFLLVSTIRENTLISKRPARSAESSKRQEQKGGKMSEAEMEKTIEALVLE